MTALPKPTELVRAFTPRLKPLCEGIYAASLLKHIIRNAPFGLSPNNIGSWE